MAVTPVGYFTDPASKVRVVVFKKKDEADDDAIKRIASEHEVDPALVKRGAPPQPKKKEASVVKLEESSVPPADGEAYVKRTESGERAQHRPPPVFKRDESREQALKVPSAFQFPKDTPFPALRERL